MKKDWKYKKLGEVCEIYNGNSINADYKKKHFLGASSGLPFIATKDVSTNGKIDYENGVRIPNFKDYKIAYTNSVFICAEGGSAGKKFAYVEQDVCFGNKLFCIKSKKESLEGKYVYHFIQSDLFKNQFYALLTGLIGGVSAKKFQQIEIPIPTLSEQRCIVKRLDAAFAHIDELKANAEKQLNEARALFQKALEKAMEPKEGWEEKKLKEIAQVRIGPFGSLLHKKDYISGGIPLVNPIHMIDGKIVANNDYTISEEKAKELSNYLLKVNDIVFARRGEVGRCALVSKDEEGYLCGTGSLFVRFITFVDFAFMQMLFQSESCRAFLEENASGATMLNLNASIVENMPLTIPPLSEQQRIVARFDSLSAHVRELEEINKKVIAECDALKQALLRKVFE